MHEESFLSSWLRDDGKGKRKKRILVGSSGRRVALSLYRVCQTQAKREREALGEEGEEMKCPKRRVMRVESEETQDYVRESLALSREEAEERGPVPSAISIPQKPFLWYDNRPSEEALSFWQFSSVVTEEGEESYTTTLCQQCYNKNLMAKGDAPLTKLQWFAVHTRSGVATRQCKCKADGC